LLSIVRGTNFVFVNFSHRLKAVDVDRSGSISAGELQKALSQVHVVDSL
jgi:hypothetical protein